MRRPGVVPLEVLREVEEILATADAADQKADEHLERAALLRKSAASHRAAALDLIHDVVRGAQRETLPPPPSRRPRLEESSNPADRERAAFVIDHLLRHPDLSVNAVAKRCGVHHNVVERLAKTLAISPPSAQKARGKPFANRRPR
jgi:hypothetical protein